MLSFANLTDTEISLLKLPTVMFIQFQHLIFRLKYLSCSLRLKSRLSSLDGVVAVSTVCMYREYEACDETKVHKWSNIRHA